ncbi:unnamed protein product, partial [Adineta steineri]
FITSIVNENVNNPDSGISSNDSEVKILIRDQNRSPYNKTTLSTIFDHNEEKGYIVELNVFKEITEIYILVPALLGLKGNLEMILASCLSTQANIGNIILTQLQAIAVLVSVAME